MRTKSVLLALTLFALCITQAGAALVNFTGNVDVDFAIPEAISMPDTVGDNKGAGLCDDEPLGQLSFTAPPPAAGIIPASGFNAERVVSAYDCATDTLFIGLDVCDGKIAWDADGDGNILIHDPNIVPGFTLHENFSDAGPEEYMFLLDMDPDSSYELRVGVATIDGGTTIVPSIVPAVPGVTVSAVVTGPDVEVSIQGLRKAFPFTGLCQPIRISTRSGATGDLVNEDVTLALFDLCCTACISITKEVSCSPTEGFGPSVTALPGAPVYFRIQVQNCGTDVLNDVTITDTLTSEVDNALLSCTGCTNGLNCIPTSTGVPVQTNIGSLLPGETKTFVCTVTTNPAFPITDVTPDAVNQVTVTGTGELTEVVVNDGPESASVNLVIPSIDCTKLVDDDDNFAVDPGDTTPPSTNFILSTSPDDVWYQICIENDGETPIDFSAGADPNCPSFNDPFLETPNAQLPGTGVDLDDLFRDELQSQFGNHILPVGQTVCIVVGPVTLDCSLQPAYPDTFTACGHPTGDFCLPPGGVPDVSTECSANVGCICVEIDKEVSCSPDGPWTESVDALRGSTIYFRITVSNPCGEDLENVTITDTLTQEVDNALVSCIGCTNGLNCMPVSTGLPIVTNIGNLASGQTKTFICTIQTNGSFAVIGQNPDATNCVSVTATGAISGTPVSDGPDCATVNLLVPGISCLKLIDDDSNTAPDGGDLTPPTTDLRLNNDGLTVEQAWYRFCLTNTGEVDANFTPGANPNCPIISDTFIKPGGTTIQKTQLCGGGSVLIPGTNVDLMALFQAQMVGNVLPAGQTLCVVVGPVQFDESQLCCTENEFPDTFSACAIATEAGICLPPSGGENVSTGNCDAKVTICPPPCIDIVKEVACSPDGPWSDSVTALRGATVYFRITVENCGGRNLTNVTITDTLDDVNNALLDCTGCTNGLNCIPGVTNIGNLIVGETKTFICTVPTNPLFDVIGMNPDATNTVSVAADVVDPGPGDPATVSAGPDSVTVDVLVPGIACSKLVDDDNNPDPAQIGDLTPPTTDLILVDPVLDVEQAWYRFCITNTGEVDASFANDAGQCPNISDTFIKPGGTTIQKTQLCGGGSVLIPGTDVDLLALFQAQMVGNVLPAGQTICVVVGPVSFDESELCCTENEFPDTFSACAIATEADICLPEGGGEIVDTGDCNAKVTICPPPCIEITKEVSCFPDGPFGPSVTALRGSTIYFRITVANCGGRNLTNVRITDTLTQEVDNALLSCSGCTNGLNCIPTTAGIPVVTNIGNLIVGETKTFVCTIQTNAAFNVIGQNPDATNCVSVQADVVDPGPGDPTTVNAGPVCATVDLLVPDITCDLLMDDDSDFSADPGDMTPPDNNLNLSMNGAPQVEQVWKKLTVCNDGEVDVSFAAGVNPDCPHFDDQLLEDFGIDVNQAFRNALIVAFGSEVLPPGQCVSVVFGPLAFDETVLCPNTPIIVNRFTACGFATEQGICLPPAGGETVDTGLCQGTILLCQPVLFQAYPGDSNGTNTDYLGHLGKSGETISAVPGVFVLVPGNNWENFVAAAQVGMPYTLKNVSLIKETPEFIQCADVFPPITVQQQGTPNIRLRWPLMYEAPGTTFTLTIQYGTSVLWDDDGVLGPHIPSYYHENVWEWKVDASLESMKLLLELFHEVPFGLDEVPLISDEVLYPILQAKLDNIIQLVADENLLEAGNALGEFEMEVADACIGVSPRSPYPTGPGTGIANTLENPACCKILIDAEWVGVKLGIFQGSK